MQGYYVAAEDTSADLDWQATMDYVADMARQTPPAMQPCRNGDCTNRSYAIFCSEPCRVALEGPEEDAYYQDPDSPTTLGLKALADTQWQADQAAGGFVAMVCGQTAPPVAAPVPPLPEAAASATVRLTIAGHSDVLFTVRDMDETRLLERLETLLQRFPVPAAAVQASAVQHPQGAGEEGWCRLHSTQMRWNPGKGGEQGWWSHKGPEGWCKGCSTAGRQRAA